MSSREDSNDATSSEAKPPQDLFDEDFYRASYGDSIPEGVAPLDDYLERGWKLGFDPSPKFSTNYYLEKYPDVAAEGFNPLVHYVLYGQDEGRRRAPYSSAKKDYSHKPALSVIIPIYNHARFLPERINSILAQKYENLQWIFLDDASSDESVRVVGQVMDAAGVAYEIVVNDRNSGSIFSQWEKGMRLAKGELVWICESDDFCDERFLREIVPLFSDESIMLAFGDIQFCDIDGNRMEGLDHYRESAEPGIWSATTVRPAAEWFAGAFLVRNVIPNVGGCVFRNQPLSDAEWATLRQYSIVGDWYFYLTVARGGRIAYEPAAQAYFRQHGLNSSVRSFGGDKFYREHEEIARQIAVQWGGVEKNLARAESNIRHQYELFHSKSGGTFKDLFDIEKIVATRRGKTHVLMCILGFSLGGGELFPIRLANMLVERGITVSILCMHAAAEEPLVRRKLDRRIAVYDAGLVEEIGKAKFLKSISADIIHSHNVAAEVFFFADGNKLDLPYIVTLHGSYEFATLSRKEMRNIASGVKHWVYLTKRNLDHLKHVKVDPHKMSRIPNAVELTHLEPQVTRADLGIPKDAFVFAVISRAIKEKGWEETARAFAEQALGTDRETHLLFCGTGPELEQMKQRHASDRIHFLGFQADPHGIYRMSDCAILASRFQGESYPLTIVEALQVCRPVICTDVGECRDMIGANGSDAGIILEPSPDDERFVGSLRRAMRRMLDDAEYQVFHAAAEAKSGNFETADMVAAYLGVYEGALVDIFGSESSSDRSLVSTTVQSPYY